ncbi:hypothetical protein PF327_04585 [Sulfurovum sp. XTW-4]|uniref:SurA N-terminal domain-containing protein n=1 Tax=Sulfurovum xiamenensis TaxID=3019066 RepID=A0ABT7QQW8_9BACT|nr:hypothetical protein [Sulfurovum xiamenensis]MDM5263466.1 hypothetical protein [Sulfurovum xiamenensis]
MHKQNFITLTLIISGLALNPVMANAVFTTVTYNQNINDSVSSGISSLLYSRGLEKEAADEITENLVSEEEEDLLKGLIEDLESEKIVSRKEVLEYLSTKALHKENVDFHSYDHLVGMVSKIKQRSLENKTLKQLQKMAQNNKYIFV